MTCVRRRAPRQALTLRWRRPRRRYAFTYELDVARGLERAERSVYICDDNTATQIAGALDGPEVDVEANGAGALRLLNPARRTPATSSAWVVP